MLFRSVKLIGMNKHRGPEDFTFLKDRAIEAEVAAYDNRTSPVIPILVNEEEGDGNFS